MSITKFFTSAFTAALETGVASADDVLAHVTPQVLGLHLPRPLWSRLLTAALGAPSLGAQTVVETIGIGNLCEHTPVPVLWGCLRSIAERALGQASAARERPATVEDPVGPGAATVADSDSEFDSALDSLLASEPAASEPGAAEPAEPDGARPRRPYRVTAGQTSRAAGASSRRPQRRSAGGHFADDGLEPGRGVLVPARDVEVDEEQLVEWSASDETAIRDRDEE